MIATALHRRLGSHSVLLGLLLWPVNSRPGSVIAPRKIRRSHRWDLTKSLSFSGAFGDFQPRFYRNQAPGTGRPECSTRWCDRHHVFAVLPARGGSSPAMVERGAGRALAEARLRGTHPSAAGLNDLTIRVATVNGSGSQSSNLVLTQAIFRLGIPVPEKRFPLEYRGLPTWFDVRLTPGATNAAAARSTARRAQRGDLAE